MKGHSSNEGNKRADAVCADACVIDVELDEALKERQGLIALSARFFALVAAVMRVIVQQTREG